MRAGSSTVTHFLAAECPSGTWPVTVSVLVPEARVTAIVVMEPVAEVRALLTTRTCEAADAGVTVRRGALVVLVPGLAETMTVPAVVVVSGASVRADTWAA